MSGSAAGVYGKHPGQADFLRAGAGEFVQAGLDQWFENATETLRRERLTLPEGPIAFLFSGPAPDVVFAGSFVPSQDAVGRSFPLILFASLPAAREETNLAALHGAWAGFIAGAAALAREAAGLSASEVAARAQALPPPSGSAGAVPPPLDHEPADSLIAALGGTPEALGYAVRTCLSACEQAAKAGAAASGASITVDAPAPTATALRFWLELMTPRLAKTRPSLLWTAGPGGRLLAALGPPPPAFLSYLANPQHRATRFWPLHTDVSAAIDGAMKALSADQRRLIVGEHPSLTDLLAAFS